MSLPEISVNTSGTGVNPKKDARTFKNNRIFEAPQVAKRMQDLVAADMYNFLLIS